ncbi:M14 family metallopeptidase [Anatilimnocola sp. NA78]|uniref:M14 family metallopeptidase n=1 Tax=Anatilimnocola sp. NA78 TaxID=3415683 RepID=UPI003CE45072
MHRPLPLTTAFVACLSLAMTSLAQEAAEPAKPVNAALAGYLKHEQLTAAIQKLDESELATVRSLGKSAGGRDVWLITLGQGDEKQRASKPAIAIMGNVQGSHLLGGELALRMAQQLVAKADDEAVKKLLGQVTLHIIPRPEPDGSEKCFAQPYRVPAGNDRKTDDDRDFAFGEDPPNDLNGDGFITQMRIEDPAGTLMPHPDDPRVLITADPKKNERGRYRLLNEGIDDDHDEQWNEDAGDGVALDRNFTFGYRPFTPNSGPNAVSEPECRAIADFLFDQPNVAVVFTFSADDNLFHPWKPNAQTEKERIRKNILGSDATAVDYLAESYKKLHGGSDAPSPPDANGQFSRWAYFHYGRWSLNARGWWVPKTQAKKEEAKEESKDDEKKDEKKEEKKSSGEKRGSEQINLLNWLAANKIDGFVEWKEIKHPDFPHHKVEVGGFKPLVDLNPPATELDKLAEKHVTFLQKLPDYLPQLELRAGEVRSLGGGVYRVKVTAVNTGYLPTMSEMGSVNGIAYPLQIEIDLPKSAVLIQGDRRSEVRRLAGVTGQAERTWLIRFVDKAPEEISIRLWAPAVGEVKTTLKVQE